MALPPFLKPYLTQAKEILSQGALGSLEFSGSTYQVQVEDAWAFLQFDERGQIKDCFCSCEEPEASSGCVHLAAAYLTLFNSKNQLLHDRFEASLWNALCRLVVEEKLEGCYQSKSCTIKPKSEQAKKALREMIEFRKHETEETSLKFFNLSPDEIERWKEGEPSERLRYELSYWNDIAKWLMLKENYRISFEHSKEKIPNKIVIDFDDVELTFSLTEERLVEVIPALATVKSPLKVHQVEHEMIESITLDKGALTIHLAKGSPKKEEREGIRIGSWSYVYNQGFYPLGQGGLLEAKTVSGHEVGALLDQHLAVIEPLIEGEEINTIPIALSYTLHFDPEWNLHLSAYAFQKGDLEYDFGTWVYVLGKGFYPLEERQFPEMETVISEHDVPDFVRHHRIFLNTQEGFQNYLRSIETSYTYELSNRGRLSFSKQFALQEKSGITKDFGPIIYLKGRGFYPKASHQVSGSLKSDFEIRPEQIPGFIRVNREELKNVRGFFMERSPVKRVGLDLELTSEENLIITPVYELFPDYKEKDVRFFDDFVYVAEEGFFQLTGDLRLPDRFRQQLELESENLATFLNFELETLQEYTKTIDKRLLKPTQLHLEADELVKAPKRGREWYRLKLLYRSLTGTVSVNTLYQTIKKKKPFLFSDAGLIETTVKDYDWLRALPPDRFEEEVVYLTTMELIRLHIFDEITVLQPHNLLQELTDFTIPEKPDTKGLKCSLRPYQEIGLNWLWFLYLHSLSGLLCDDMGLGKTHQAMGLMAAIRNSEGGKGFKFLIICPTSVIYHWEEKLAKFFPEPKVLTFYGSQRSLKGEFDVLLTSYGVWRIEKELLRQIPFELAIFDEVQIAKNHNSRIHAALLAANANMRLGLTGTPIENYLRELKALFDLVLPSYMPNHADYRRLFVRPVEREGNFEKRKLLSRFIHPFVLRRKKDQVLLDLPSKTEEISHCDLSFDQKLLYTDVLHRSRESLLRELKDSGASVPYIHIFAVLTHLKQICNHPAVYLKEAESYKDYASGKWDLFIELLHEALDSEQKVVIYSQFLVMLDIIEHYLQEQGIEYASIRGSTVQRGEEVKRFNTDPKCRVFVGSLRAAGLGIDLTAASVVIHYDRWWNAAREDQATDRIHRIGQTRGVQVFKLVTKGTFEERIDEMIKKKGQLMEEVVGLDDHQILKSFNREDIIELLQYLEAES